MSNVVATLKASNQLETLKEYVEHHLEASQGASIKMNHLGHTTGEIYTSGESGAYLAVLGMIDTLLQE